MSNNTATGSLVVGGLAAVLLLGGTWAGTTWYSGHKVEQIYQHSIQKVGKDSMGMISMKLTSYERGFLHSKANWELSLTLDPCKPDDSIVLAGYDNIRQGFIPSLGWASVDSHIIWPDAVQAKLKEVFAKREPLKIHSRVNLLGNISSHITSPPVEWVDEAIKLSWAGMSADVSIANQKQLKLEVDAPKLMIQSAGSTKDQFLLEKIRYNITQSDYSSPFSDGSASFKAGNLALNVGGQAWALKSLEFGSESSNKNDVLTLKAGYDIDKIELNQQKIGDFSTRLSLNNVKTAAATEAYKAFAEFQKQCHPTPDALVNALKPILRNGFNVKVERADLTLFDGQATLNGQVVVPALTDADLQVPEAIVRKVAANGVLQVSNKLLVGIFNQASQLKGQPPSSVAEAQQAIDMLMQGGVQQGYVNKTADGYQTTFAFKAGQTLINGKAVGPLQKPENTSYEPQ